MQRKSISTGFVLVYMWVEAVPAVLTYRESAKVGCLWRVANKHSHSPNGKATPNSHVISMVLQS